MTLPTPKPRFPSWKSSSTSALRTASAGALVEFKVDDTECVVTFKGPGYSADAFIDRDSGHYTLTQSYHGPIAILNDLHKGRDTGFAWSIFIDVSAILLIFISLSGLVLLFYLKLRRGPGLVVVAVGTVAGGGIVLLGSAVTRSVP